MKRITITVMTVLMLAAGAMAQQQPDLRAAGRDLLGALAGDMERAERGMKIIYVLGRRGVFMISASRVAPPQMGKPLLEMAVSDFDKLLKLREQERTFSKGSAHKRGELLTGLADGWNRMGNPDKARAYFERIVTELSGTVYEQKAKAWLEDKPEARSPQFFACTGCHVD